MLRVLFFEISDTFGGIESFLLNVLDNIDLKKNKIEFDFVTNADKPASEKEFIAAGVRMIHISPKRKVIKYKKDLEKLFREGHYDIVHIQKNSLSNALPLSIAKKYDVPFILHAQNSAPSHDNVITSILHNINKKLYSDKAFIKLACGENAAKWMFKSVSNVKYIKNGINLDDFKLDTSIRDEIRSRFKVEDNIVICNVGRFTQQKNHSFLIDIFKEFHDKEPKSKLFLVGNGVKMKEIKEKVDRLGLKGSVIFFGSLPKEKERKVLMGSDVFLMPSLYEGVSIASVEAQVAGLQLLVSDTVDRDTNITGNVTFLSLKDSKELWANMISKVLIDKKQYDYEFIRRKIREAGYDMKYTTEELIRLYNKGKIER